MSKKSVTIHAILTTLSPLHIASPETFRYEVSDSTGYGLVKNGTKGGIACAGIQRRRFAPGSVDGLDYGVAVIAANNIAGRLRRQGAQILVNVLREKNQKITLQTYSAITCGAVTGKPDSRDLTFAEYKEVSSHPYVGLFGGGPRMLRRRMRVLDAVPVMDSLRSSGFSVGHPRGVGKATSGMNISRGAAFRRGDDVSALLDVDRMEGVVTDFEVQFNARQRLIIEDQLAKDAEEKGSRNSTKAWSAFEFVDPGVDFDFTVELTDVTDAQIGLFLLSLDGLAKTSIGGQTRNGLGRIRLNDVAIAINTGDNVDVTDTIFNNNSLIKADPSIAVYLNAWKIAASELSGERLDAIMKPPVIATDEEKAAKAVDKERKAEEKALKAAEEKAAKALEKEAKAAAKKLAR
ncbi:MAG: type IV CRISPR-associated protein Csf2 [bacterium]|nr:type IV CRISPR-associated protein Csf2 [bacterium]